MALCKSCSKNNIYKDDYCVFCYAQNELRKELDNIENEYAKEVAKAENLCQQNIQVIKQNTQKEIKRTHQLIQDLLSQQGKNQQSQLQYPSYPDVSITQSQSKPGQKSSYQPQTSNHSQASNHSQRPSRNNNNKAPMKANLAEFLTGSNISPNSSFNGRNSQKIDQNRANSVIKVDGTLRFVQSFEVDMGRNCVKCKEPFENNQRIYDMNCGHVYHKECLEDLIRNGSTLCVCCNHRLNK